MLPAKLRKENPAIPKSSFVGSLVPIRHLDSCCDPRLHSVVELPARVLFQLPKVEGHLQVQPVPRIDAEIPSQASGGIRRDGPAPGQDLAEAALRDTILLVAANCVMCSGSRNSVRRMMPGWVREEVEFMVFG
jgi:hypothetical protein